MITSIVWTEDSKLLLESNLTARQPRRVLITLLPYAPRGAHGAEISIQISTLAGVWTSDLSLGSLARNRYTTVHPRLHLIIITIIFCIMIIPVQIS